MRKLIARSRRNKSKSRIRITWRRPTVINDNQSDTKDNRDNNNDNDNNKNNNRNSKHSSRNINTGDNITSNSNSHNVCITNDNGNNSRVLTLRNHQRKLLYFYVQKTPRAK